MRILIGSPVRQKPEVFEHYLNSLDNLVIPDGCEIDRYFLLHDCPELAKCLKQGEYLNVTAETDYKVTDETHIWTYQSINHMVEMRNMLRKKVLDDGYDYFLMVDSDIILHPNTLEWLINTQKDIVAEVFWTRTTLDSENVWANAWHYNQSELIEDEVVKWLTPGLYQVGMSGACILISRKVLEKVDYSPISNVNFIGEDRYFCIRAAVHGFDIWLDTHVPAIHLYREHEQSKYDPKKTYDENILNVLGGEING